MKTRIARDSFAKSPLVFATTSATISDITTSAYFWKIEFYGYKSYYLGHEDSPITDGSFSITTFGSGNADIDLGRLTLPLKSQDRINIYYKGNKLWSGFLSKEPDKREGKLELSPQIEKFQNALYNGSLSGSWTTNINSILSQTNSITDIAYNVHKINISSTETANISYSYTNVKSIFDDMIANFDGKYYGVDAINEMFISSYSTTITKTIYCDDLPAFSDITVKIDDSKIKNTRAQVFQRTTSNNNIRIGQVGYADPYPALTEIEQRTGIKETKLTVPTALIRTPSSQNEALNYAYQQIKSEAQINTVVSIRNLDYDRYPLSIGEKIRVYQPEALVWQTILNNDSISGWNNAQAVSVPKRGTGSIQISTAISSYEFERSNFFNIKKIGFFLYANNYGNLIDFCLQNALNTGSTYSYGLYSINSGIESSCHQISYFTPNTWQWVEIPTTWNDFSAITIQALTTDSIYIDEISIYGYSKNYYDVNVREIKFNFNNNLVDVTAGYFDEGINDEFFKLQKKVKELEETLQA